MLRVITKFTLNKMVKLALISLLLFAINFGVGTGFPIHCDFFVVGPSYFCVASWAYDGSNDNVTSVEGNHYPGRNDADVTIFYANIFNLTSVPRNLEGVFPNLNELLFFPNNITSVTNADLRPHSRLTTVNFENNRITHIDSNLFDGLPNLREVNFRLNNISHIGEDIQLPTSGRIDFRNNSCVNLLATTNVQIADLKINLLVRCSSRTYLMEESLARLKEKNSQLEDRVALLEERINGTGF